jgi:membrane protein implicated in regulation of membrane protease activity
VFFVYLFAAVAGCLLVLVSLFGGGHQDADASAALDHASADMSADGAGHGRLLGDGHSGHHDTAGGLPSALGWLLSVQVWTYLLAFGGATGLLLRLVAHVAEPLAAAGALTVGLGSAVTARLLLRRIVNSADSGTTSHDRLIGSSAQVLIPAAAGATGKIRLSARGQLLDLLARASDGGPLTEGAPVSILEIRDGVAEVTRDDDEPGALAARPAARPALAATAHSAPADPAVIKSKG